MSKNQTTKVVSCQITLDIFNRLEVACTYLSMSKNLLVAGMIEKALLGIEEGMTDDNWMEPRKEAGLSAGDILNGPKT
jgi:hypothetical protein